MRDHPGVLFYLTARLVGRVDSGQAANVAAGVAARVLVVRAIRAMRIAKA